MELTGMPLAQTARMRERTVATTPSLVTTVSSSVSSQTPGEMSAGTAEENRPAGSGDLYEGLDKYDISLIACTD